MRPYNEADTRAKLIDPKLKLAGWGEGQIEREHYFEKGKAFTAGRIYLVGDEARRREPRRADYLLRYRGAMIAVLEAKDESHSPDAGLEQAKAYARLLDLPFALASNGHRFVEFDFLTNTSRELDQPPSPDELWERWQNGRSMAAGAGGGGPADPLLYPYCPAAITGTTPRYFQEVAIRRVIERVVQGQRRVLLTMATGTGKTYTAFQIVWKLKKSGWLKRPVLFLADRVILRDQAYNAFSPFASGQADPRSIIASGNFNPNRDLYFSLYQGLDAEVGGVPFYAGIPRDFFGLIIVDECHRSGFGKWNAILQHFSSATQLGMTATPKQSENIDTYAYFCAEEPEIEIDPDDPAKGTWRPPAFMYSLGKGIDDGFLAPYKIHRVRTTLDRDGLKVEEAKGQGAHIYIPEGAEPRDLYETPQFEREITLPDRTAAMVKHLAGLLRSFDPMEKTIVFCVDMDHARLTARLLQNEFAGLGLADYAVPIISEEGEATTWLERFRDSDQKSPVVAITAELLSTGVDVPSCRNIAFMKPIASPILFKQIVGRGTRLDAATGKQWFRIIDYVGATRLFDEWDALPTEPKEEENPGPRDCAVEGQVVDSESGALIVGANVAALIGRNEQEGPVRTDNDGAFRFENLPVGSIRLRVTAAGFRPRTLSVDTESGLTQRVTLELKAQSAVIGKIEVKGLSVTIADEVTFRVDATGEHLSLSGYLQYTGGQVRKQAPGWDQLHALWTERESREAFLTRLREESVYPEILARVLSQPRADEFDLLAHVAFGAPVRTRDERADGFLNREEAYLRTYTPQANEVVMALLEKYRLWGIEEMTSPSVFRLAPFREMGQAPGVIRRFGSVEALREALHQMQIKLYRKDAL
ncbi:MAG: EcoAI/FtnUII family type I restriction enzme subunit R [Bacillota bacterium]